MHTTLTHLIPTAVDCGDLDDPDNGDVTLTGTTLGSIAIYSCNNGYFLEGKERRVCQSNREWTGRSPVCRRMSIFSCKIRYKCLKFNAFTHCSCEVWKSSQSQKWPGKPYRNHIWLQGNLHLQQRVLVGGKKDEDVPCKWTVDGRSTYLQTHT